MIKGNYAVLDTETISLEKPFCYNLGYKICSPNGLTLLRKDFIIKQVWENKPLFETAYYSSKKDIYVSKLRGKSCKILSWGWAVNQMEQDLQDFEVHDIFIYNADFDVRVLNFNCEWFKSQNPLETRETHCVLKMFQNYAINNFEYLDFVKEHELLSQSGKQYSSNAETAFKFISGKLEFVEEHTALADCEIEDSILQFLVEKGVDPYVEYKTKFMPNVPNKGVVMQGKEIITEFEFTTQRKKKNENVYIFK